MGDDVDLIMNGPWSNAVDWFDITTGTTMVPGASDEVTIASGLGGVISGDGSADSLTVATPYFGSYEFDGTISTNTFELAGTPSASTMGPGLIVDGGDLEASLNIVIGEGATLSVSGDGLLTGPAGGQLEDFGEIDVTGGTVTSLEMSVYGTFDLESGMATVSTLVVGSYTGMGGTGGEGVLIIGSGGSVTVSDALVIATQQGLGTIDVNGGGLTVNGEADVSFDSQGQGTLNVTAGGSVSVSGTFDVAAEAGAVGGVLVSGSGSSLSLNGDAIIGDAGSGALSIANAGVVDVSSGTIVAGSTAGSSGTIAVTGDDSSLSVSGLIVGDGGYGELDINQGMVDISGGAATLGQSSGGAGLVNLGTASLNLSGSLTIGRAGSGTFAVGSDGNLQAQSIVLGAMTGSGGSLSIAGDGATGQSSNLTVGASGTGELSISAQGSLDTTGAAILGSSMAPLAEQQASIVGQGQWTVGSVLDVGQAGNAAVEIGTGGEVWAGGVILGDQSGATGTVSVSGTVSSSSGTVASSLFYGGTLTIGGAGAGTVMVSDGGLVGVAGAGTIDIGASSTGSGTLSLIDPGSTLYANLLAVGGSGTAPGGSGVMSISNGATVDAAYVTVWAKGAIDLAGGVLITDPITIVGDVTGYGTITGSVVDNGTIDVQGGTLVLSSNTLSGSGLVEIQSGSDALIGPVGAGGLTFDLQGSAGASFTGSIGSGNTIDFVGSGGSVSLQAVAGAFDPSAVFAGFGTGDSLLLNGATVTSAVYVAGSGNMGMLGLFDGAVQVGSLDLAGSFTSGSFTATTVGAGETALSLIVCFLAGTLISTPAGQVPVERLAAGDIVLTHAGRTRPIVWVGTGRVLATRGQRNAATPVVVRKGALADNVPSSDLRVTKAHSLYVDGVLIPVEFLVNHRSIVWDDHAQEVTIYHIELETHDVLMANGAPAESYRDDGNRWLFRNANSGWSLPPQEPCAPVMTDGPLLDAVWRRLLDRAGPRRSLPLTEDADMHLLIDGRRLDATKRVGDVYVFELPKVPSALRIVSRSAAPTELGLDRDPRVLGVAVRRLAVRKGARFRVIEADDERLQAGFHSFEADRGLRWTDGDAVIPAGLYSGFTGPFEVVLHIGGATYYLADGDVQRVA